MRRGTLLFEKDPWKKGDWQSSPSKDTGDVIVIHVHETESANGSDVCLRQRSGDEEDSDEDKRTIMLTTTTKVAATAMIITLQYFFSLDGVPASVGTPPRIHNSRSNMAAASILPYNLFIISGLFERRVVIFRPRYISARHLSRRLRGQCDVFKRIPSNN